MSIFYHNDDPLLFNKSPLPMFQDAQHQNINDAYANFYKQQMLMEMQQQQQTHKDWLGDLDIKMKELDKSAIELLGEDTEFAELNNKLQSMVQSEIMGVVKVKLNTSQQAVDNIKRQMEIINNVNQKVKENERQNLSEIHDYMKNYSNMSFDDYKKLKSRVNDNKETKDIKETTEPQEVKFKNKKNKYEER